MTITSRVSLASTFETGDKPVGSDYSDWIDSYLHLTDTSAQSISSPVTFNASASFQTLTATDISVSGVGAALVSTGRLVVSAASGGAYSIDSINVSGRANFDIVSANTVSVDKLEVSGSANFKDLQVSGIGAALISVGRIQVSGVSANSVWVNRLEAVSAVIVSASFPDAFLLNGARIRVTAAIPTVGQHAQGDMAFNSGPAAGGTVGWVNVVAGAPGTWKEFGVIEV